MRDIPNQDRADPKTPWRVYDACGMDVNFALLEHNRPGEPFIVATTFAMNSELVVLFACLRMPARERTRTLPPIADQMPRGLDVWSDVFFEVTDLVDEGAIVFASRRKRASESLGDWKRNTWLVEIRNVHTMRTKLV